MGPAANPVGEPDARNPHVRFDEREVETEWVGHHRATSRLYSYSGVASTLRFFYHFLREQRRSLMLH